MVRQPWTHVVECEIGIWVNRLICELRKRARTRLKSRGMTPGTTGVEELVRTLNYRVIDRTAPRRRQEPHEIREGVAIVEYRLVHPAAQIEDAVRRSDW